MPQSKADRLAAMRDLERDAKVNGVVDSALSAFRDGTGYGQRDACCFLFQALRRRLSGGCWECGGMDNHHVDDCPALKASLMVAKAPVGSMVRLPSDDTLMTVVANDGEHVDCVWMARGGELQRFTLPVVALHVQRIGLK